MKIVFTMAGNYTRFKPFGARVPKYLLPIGDSTILSNIINEIKVCHAAKDMIFIANRNDQLFYPILKSILINTKFPWIILFLLMTQLANWKLH